MQHPICARPVFGRSRFRQAGILLAASMALLHAPALSAQELAGDVHIHGFGGWSYGRTNLNRYLSGIRLGDYQTASFALNVLAHPTERLAIVSQIELIRRANHSETELDYAFAEWSFSDAVRLQAGKITHPFGIYTEVYEVGTLRPFLTLPQSIYADVGFSSESFEGVGLRGRVSPGRGWNLAYNVYAGGVTLEVDERPLAALTGENPGSGELSLREVLGARVIFSPPVGGLSIGFSGYSGIAGVEETARETALGAQLEFLTDRVWIRGEVARQWEAGGPRLTAQYAELAVFLTRGIQAAFMYDRLRTTIPGPDASSAPNLLRHTEGALGLNYWPRPELGFKSSIHFVSGNRLAFPDGATAAELLNPNFDRRGTRLVQLGVQFSF
jgi:hypothetical protein